MSQAGSTDVLICGAGAAGLTLAIDLARRGVAFRLIDKLQRPFAGSRGKGIQPRTLEVMEDLGFVDRIAAVSGTYPTRLEYKTDGTSRQSESYPVSPPSATEPYRTTLLVPQFQTEAVMRERLAEFGCAPEYGHELAGFTQDEDGVTAEIAGPGGPQTINCRYLIGADGGRSFVRHVLNVDFPGKTLGVGSIVADLVLDGLGRDFWYRFNIDDSDRQVALCPLPHLDLYQLQARIPPGSDQDLSPAGLQAFLDERLPGRGVTVRGVNWASNYSMNARLADRYRVGRVFLMGDAAHIHPPTGGQGLNTSVQDAYNLGWKLGAVLGGAPDALLDSYEAERRPVAANMLGMATGFLAKVKEGDMRRGRETNQLDLGYPASPVSLDFPAPQGKAQAGDRAPDAPLTGAGGQPRRLFDLFRGPHWTLIARGNGRVPLPPTGRGLRIHRVGATGEFRDTENHLGTTYGMDDGDLLLVRPDGYIGGLTPATEGGRIARHLAGFRVGGAAA